MTRGQSAVGSRQSERVAGDPLEARNGIASYRDLRIWNLAIELTVAAYQHTRTYPKSEIYGLTSQTQRSATSIAANIAEGYGRDSTGSYVQFLRVAQGSLKEFETHFIVAARIGYLDATVERDLLHRSDDVGRMLRALIRGIQRAS